MAHSSHALDRQQGALRIGLGRAWGSTRMGLVDLAGDRSGHRLAIRPPCDDDDPAADGFDLGHDVRGEQVVCGCPAPGQARTSRTCIGSSWRSARQGSLAGLVITVITIRVRRED